MTTVDPAKRRALRAKAHHLHPVVSVGTHGLTPAVLHEMDVNLLAHELIKVRVFSDHRSERETLFARICSELDAAPVQHLGKILVLYRPKPPDEPAPKPAKRTRHAPTAGERRPATRRQPGRAQPGTTVATKSRRGAPAAGAGRETRGLDERPPKVGAKRGAPRPQGGRDFVAQSAMPAGTGRRERRTPADGGKHPPRPRRRRG